MGTVGLTVFVCYLRKWLFLNEHALPIQNKEIYFRSFLPVGQGDAYMSNEHCSSKPSARLRRQGSCGFADKIFRVFGKTRPELELVTPDQTDGAVTDRGFKRHKQVRVEYASGRV